MRFIKPSKLCSCFLGQFTYKLVIASGIELLGILLLCDTKYCTKFLIKILNLLMVIGQTKVIGQVKRAPLYMYVSHDCGIYIVYIDR